MPSTVGAGKRAALIGAGRMGLAMASGWMRDLAGRA
jgi:pyrroline-5-carboxylate reductase